MGTNSGYTRRQELRCTIDEMETYGSAILYEGEVIYVKQEDGEDGEDGIYAIKVGDGKTSVADLPYSVNYKEIMNVAKQIPDAKKAAESACTDAEKAVQYAWKSYDHAIEALKSLKQAQDSANAAETAKEAAESAKTAAEEAADVIGTKLAEANGMLFAKNIAYNDSFGVVGATDVQSAIDSIAYSFRKISALDELKNIENWATVKDLVDCGLAPYMFEVGHTFIDGPLTWRVVNVTINELKLQCTRCLPAKPIPWNRNWDSEKATGGSYKDSSVRDYMLNTFAQDYVLSDLEAIVADSNAPLWNKDSNTIEYLTDKFFIPSVDELNCVRFGGETEGSPDAYYATAFSSPSDGPTPLREIRDGADYPQACWTRSYHPAGEAALIYGWSGEIKYGTTNSTNNGYYLLPTCIIRRKTLTEE